MVRIRFPPGVSHANFSSENSCRAGSGGVVQRTIVGQAPCSCARASGPHRVLRARQTERTAGLPLGWRRVNPSAELMVDPGQVRGARSGTRVPL
jgi:hypothetical protein